MATQMIMTIGGIVNDLERTARRQYNQSFKPTLGSNDWDDPMNPMNPNGINHDMLTTIELCEEFTQLHEKDSDNDGVYVDDDAFPDSFYHTAWQNHQKNGGGKFEFNIARALNKFDKLRKAGIIA